MKIKFFHYEIYETVVEIDSDEFLSDKNIKGTTITDWLREQAHLKAARPEDRLYPTERIISKLHRARVSFDEVL